MTFSLLDNVTLTTSVVFGSLKNPPYIGKTVKRRMKWAGMKDDKLPKSAETKKQEGSRKRGRPQLRWENCVKRDQKKAEEEEKWRERANNRDQWKQIPKVAIHRSDQ